jgi:predicted metalloendopeptidase
MSTTASTEEAPKCPCCNNPWAAATGDFFAKLCSECEETKPNDNQSEEQKQNEQTSSLKQYLDESISPKDDFYHYVNGTWMKENPIPAGYPSWNTFLTLHTLSQERLKDLLTQDKKVSHDNGNGNGSDDGDDDDHLNAIKVKAFYNAAMDEEKIEQLGIEPMSDLLALCDKAALEKEQSNEDGVAVCLGQILKCFGVSSFFSIGTVSFLLYAF